MYLTAVQLSNLKFISPALLLQVTVTNFHSAMYLCGKPYGNTKREYNIPCEEQVCYQPPRCTQHSPSYNPSYHNVSRGAVHYNTSSGFQSC